MAIFDFIFTYVLLLGLGNLECNFYLFSEINISAKTRRGFGKINRSCIDREFVEES